MRIKSKFYIIFLIIVSKFTIALNTLDSLSLIANSTSTVATFSLRKLNSTFSDLAIQVKRSFENTLLDISFIVKCELDTPSLLRQISTGQKSFDVTRKSATTRYTIEFSSYTFIIPKNRTVKN